VLFLNTILRVLFSIVAFTHMFRVLDLILSTA
jgi:hypothetical protein